MTRTIFTFKNIRCGAYDNYLEQNIFEGEGGGEGGGVYLKVGRDKELF